MRLFLLALLPVTVLGGCRGYLADHVRPEASIIGPELTRYGLSAEQSQCVGGRLTTSLSTWQLRQLANVTRLIKDQAQLQPSSLVWLSRHVKDPKVAPEVARAAEGCNLGAAPPPAAVIAAAPEPAPPAATTPPSATPAPATAAARSPMWLNLGAGIDKKSISIDASTLSGEMPLRQAWFRIVTPGATSTVNSYLLQIHCTAKTVNPLSSRRLDEKGGVAEETQHGPNGAGANPIQGGSVIEIAYLSLCT